MNINSNNLNILDSRNNCLQIKSNGNLTSLETGILRSVVSDNLYKSFSTLYLDFSKADDIDLSGINEVVHTYYALRQISKKMVFVFKKNSTVHKWIDTTGLGKFIETAMVN